MSRNIGSAFCYFCQGDVRLVEERRLITREDCAAYHSEYQHMLVANAECVDCCAKYLAWVELPGETMGHTARRKGDERPFVDLSFRSTFNDEPGEADLPDHEIEIVRVRKPWPHRCRCCNTKVTAHQGAVCRTCEETVLLAARALINVDNIENVIWERARKLAPLVAQRFMELPELRHRFDAAHRLGATVDSVRELARELLPLPLPPPPEAA